MSGSSKMLLPCLPDEGRVWAEPRERVKGCDPCGFLGKRPEPSERHLYGTYAINWFQSIIIGLHILCRPADLYYSTYAVIKALYLRIETNELF